MRQFILFFFVLLPFCAKAQMRETFDAPLLSEEWSSLNRDSFQINESGWLELAMQPKGSGSISIERTIPYSSNMQWEFDVFMRNAPSDQNKLCVFLYQADAKHFFYVRIGQRGKNELSLMRTGKEKLIESPTLFSFMPMWIRVKVTLENNERWTLYTQTKDMKGYHLEGTCTYPIQAPPQQGKFNLTFYYTKSKSSLFCIDNIFVTNQITSTPIESEVPLDPQIDPENSQVEPTNPPASPVELPKLLDVELLTESLLRYTFDLPVLIDRAVFQVQGIGTAYKKSYVDAEKKTAVFALFDKQLEYGKSYICSCQGVTDLHGKELPADSKIVNYSQGEDELVESQLPVTVEPGALLINEVMAKPEVVAKREEYVELYNTTEKSISLYGWVLMNVKSRRSRPLPDLVLLPGQYAVLYKEGKTLDMNVEALPVPIAKFPPLNDKGTQLNLYDAGGNLIDSMRYTQATMGRSWERDALGWFLSNDKEGGTPGYANSSRNNEQNPPILPDPVVPPVVVQPDQPNEPPSFGNPDSPLSVDLIQPGEIVINELLPDPFVGGSEYIELYNCTEKELSVANLSFAIRKSNGMLNTRYPLATVTTRLKAKGYLVLSKLVTGVTDFYEGSDPTVCCEVAKLPVLANTASTLVLFRTTDGRVIDELSYSSQWHSPLLKERKGVSLERINPDAATQDQANWCSAAESVGFGTPGYQNSQYLVGHTNLDTGIEPPVWSSVTGAYSLSYLLDQAGYSCRAFVYNTSGIRVAEIAKDELLGISGQLVWSGMANNGSPLQPGVYIFYAEVYHPTGQVKRIKRAFLIH